MPVEEKHLDGKSIESRIERELRLCGVAEGSMAAALERLCECAGFLNEKMELGNGLKTDSSLWNYRAKLEAVAQAFASDGLTFEAYRDAALKQPSLFYRSPDTIASNITTLVNKFATEGLTTTQYIQAALKQPSLFTQSPDTIGRHIRWAKWLERFGVIKIKENYTQNANESGINPVLYWMLNNPKYFTIGSENYKLRFYYAKLLEKDASMGNLTCSRKKIETELENAFGTSKLDGLKKLYKEQRAA